MRRILFVRIPGSFTASLVPADGLPLGPTGLRIEEELYASVLMRYSPLVERFPGGGPAGCKQFFVDLGPGDPDDGLDMARRLRRELFEELSGSPGDRSGPEIGLATGKLAAHCAAGTATNEDVAFVPEGRERAFLAPFPIETIWDLEEASYRSLHQRGIHTLGQLASASSRDPVTGWAQRLARGKDRRPVSDWSPALRETAACFLPGADLQSLPGLLPHLASLANRLARRLLLTGRRGAAVTLTLHVSGGHRVSGGRLLVGPRRSLRESGSALLEEILPRALDLTERTRRSSRSMTVLTEEAQPFEPEADLWLPSLRLLRQECDPHTASPLRFQLEVLELSVMELAPAVVTAGKQHARQAAVAVPPAERSRLLLA